MNPFDYKSYIEKLCIMSNNYYIFDEDYIKNKYNIKSYDKFRKYFKKNHTDKLIFNSEKSENFFIKVMNIDPVYMDLKYGNMQTQTIIQFFILRNNCYFNICDEENEINNKKTHKNNCNCKIKVKSIVNLSINALIFILIENNLTKKQIIDDNNNNNNNNLLEIKHTQNNIENSKIIKLYNNESNKKIIDSIKKIENIKKNLGIHKDNNNYMLTDTKPEVLEPYNYTIDKSIIHEVLEKPSLTVNNIIDDTKKLNEQLISESINLDYEDNNSSYYKNKIFKKASEKQDTEKSNNVELSNRFNNLKNYALQNTLNNHFNLDNIKSSSSESNSSANRFGNIVIKENKVKIEKKQPIDLKNSSDILISYNENNTKNIKNNFIQIENIHNNNEINEINEINEKNKSESESESVSESESESESESVSESESKSESQIKVSPIKQEVIEILNYLDENFNYITSDDILIDKDKKMQICTFMVEVKYKIFGMFRQLEKIKSVNQHYKSRISSNYEKIYYYVVQSNKIGSTGEMVEFKNNKDLIQYIITDINQI